MNVVLQFKGPRFTTGYYWKNNLKQMGHSVRHYKSYRCKKASDLIIRIDDASEEMSDFGECDCPKALIATDTTNDRGIRLLKIANNFDYIFFPQKLGMEIFIQSGYDRRKLFYLPNAGDESVHCVRKPYKKKYDVAIIGGDYISSVDNFSRKDFFEMIKKHYPKSYTGRCHYKKMARVYSQARIGLNVAVGDVNMRNYEITASGTMLLTEEVNAIEDFDQLFKVGSECDVYPKRDWDAMFSKIEYYLEHKTERERIAKAGNQRFLTCHTYKHRIETLLNTIFYSD